MTFFWRNAIGPRKNNLAIVEDASDRRRTCEVR